MAAMAACRAQGFQVGVAVVDRSGLSQVFLRDRFAGAHTVDVATNKAWTAASLRTSTLELATESQAGKPMSGIRSTARMLAVGGGVVIKGGGSSYGGIGVSGDPGGDDADACAKSGHQGDCRQDRVLRRELLFHAPAKASEMGRLGAIVYAIGIAIDGVSCSNFKDGSPDGSGSRHKPGAQLAPALADSHLLLRSTPAMSSSQPRRAIAFCAAFAFGALSPASAVPPPTSRPDVVIELTPDRPEHVMRDTVRAYQPVQLVFSAQAGDRLLLRLMEDAGLLVLGVEAPSGQAAMQGARSGPDGLLVRLVEPGAHRLLVQMSADAARLGRVANFELRLRLLR